MALDPLSPSSFSLSCPTTGCDAHLDFTVRRNGGTPVRETCPSCGTHLTLQAGRLQAGALADPLVGGAG